MPYSGKNRVALPFGASLTFHLYQTNTENLSDILDPEYFKGIVGRRGFMAGDWIFAQTMDGFSILAVRSIELDKVVNMELVSSSILMPMEDEDPEPEPETKKSEPKKSEPSTKNTEVTEKDLEPTKAPAPAKAQEAKKET